MNYLELLAAKTHLLAKLGYWMSQCRTDRANEYRAELAKVEAKIDAELEGDLILS